MYQHFRVDETGKTFEKIKECNKLHQKKQKTGVGE
jgi:hypothetical protein